MMFCRCCNKPIAKRTLTHWIRREQSKYDHPNTWDRYHYIGNAPWPTSKADCQRLTNDRVVSVQYGTYQDQDDRNPTHVRRFSTWDGVSYHPKWSYFCTNDCAAAYGKAAAAVVSRRKLAVAR